MVVLMGVKMVALWAVLWVDTKIDGSVAQWALTLADLWADTKAALLVVLWVGWLVCSKVATMVVEMAALWAVSTADLMAVLKVYWSEPH